MEQISDGTGTSYLVKVDSKHRMYTYSIIEDEPSFINRVEQEVYSGSWDGAIQASSVDDYIVYLKNTSSKDMVITKIKHRCTGGNGTISFWVNVLGTPGGTLTPLTPSNRNARSNNTANCDYYKSANITGLTNGRKVGSIYGKDGEEFENAIPCGGFILPPNATFGVKSNDTSTLHYGGIAFYFRDSED